MTSSQDETFSRVPSDRSEPRRGLPLAEACVRAGTSYADLSGEVLFIHDSVDRYHDAAAANGTRIVHACSVDSIPSDLGVMLLAEHARETGHIVLIRPMAYGARADSRVRPPY